MRGAVSRHVVNGFSINKHNKVKLLASLRNESDVQVCVFSGRGVRVWGDISDMKVLGLHSMTVELPCTGAL